MAVTRTSPAAEECAHAVGDTFGSVLALIDEWRALAASGIDRAGGVVRARDIDAVVEPLVVPHLATPGALIIGGGFVAAPGFLSDAPWHLAWWLGHSNTFGIGSADPSVRRLVAEEDPASVSFRDYTALEWWRVPARTAAPHITGPYVDYLCTDDYTLTLTVPVLHAGAMVGVVGADLYVNDIERILLPHVRAIAGTATVVNGAGRVVVSTDPHRATGSLLRPDAHDGAQRLACGSSGLSLLVAP
jgi:hypothetical protein